MSKAGKRIISAMKKVLKGEELTVVFRDGHKVKTTLPKLQQTIEMHGPRHGHAPRIIK